MKARPDATFVWNELQRRDAAELHSVPRESVVVTGAQLFDPWFDREPSTTPEEFAAKVGLEATRYVLYVGSSPNIAPPEREIPFVRRWLEALRATGDSPGALVRPHPYNVESWADEDLTGLGAVVAPRTPPTMPMSEADDALYFDSIHHASAVVGINTSAMVEALHPAPAGADDPGRRVRGDPGGNAPLPGAAGRCGRCAAESPAPSTSTSASSARRWTTRAPPRPGPRPSCSRSCGRGGSTARRRRSSPTRSRRRRVDRRLPFRLRRNRRAAMTILLVIKNTANLRTLAPVVRLLAERGHEVAYRLPGRQVAGVAGADDGARRRQPSDHRRRASVHPPVGLERPGGAAPPDDRLPALPRAGLPRLAEAACSGRVGGSSGRSTAGERGRGRFRAARRRHGASCRGSSAASTLRRGLWRSCRTSAPTCC